MTFCIGKRGVNMLFLANVLEQTENFSNAFL